MTFTERFQPFVCEGDSIACEAQGFEIIARIVREFRGSENAPGERFPEGRPDAPDQRQDGFWPSLYKDAPGLLGEADKDLVRGTKYPPNGHHRERFAQAQAKAEAVMEAWREGQWFYCGIVLSVALEGVTLEPHAASLWGVEANYPDSDNAYLTEVAQELLPEAVDTGRAAARRLCAALETSGARG